jgi:hypothetical protein
MGKQLYLSEDFNFEASRKYREFLGPRAKGNLTPLLQFSK